MALTTLTKVKDWYNGQINESRDAELTLAISRASAWIARVTGRIIENDDTTYTERFDGAEAYGGDTLYLLPGRRPVVFADVAVTEDGTALTTAQGYNATAGVWVVNAGEDRQCILKRNGVWSSGFGMQNIVVTYKCGYTTIPVDIEQLANEVSLLFYLSPKWVGSSSVAREGASTVWEKSLTPLARQTLSKIMAVG